MTTSVRDAAELSAVLARGERVKYLLLNDQQARTP
jgi:hypothetical protein